MKKTLDKIIDYAVKIADPEMIILFGSMSTGTANTFSDVDLLIVSEGLEMKHNIVDLVMNFAKEFSLRADILVCSKSELEVLTDKQNSFVKAIIKSGKICYKKS